MLTANPMCAWRCGRLAVEDDHIVPVIDGGHPTDPANRQGLCSTCHDIKTRREAARGQGLEVVASMVPLTLVCGPPCSGKSTHVAKHMHEGDLLVDVDRLHEALGLPDLHQQERRLVLLPFALQARDAILERLTRPSDVRHAWVIASAPTRRERARFVNGRIVVLDVPAAECHRRADEAGRPEKTHQWIDQWWNTYQPG